ncbi:MAG: hypothetical protein RL033_6428 [Pseudomonadota bacterium]|jgi:hypothetical protein
MGIGKELLVSLGTALATGAGLFAMQLWYASYLDVAVIHGDVSDVRMGAKLEAIRNEEQARLASGTVPIQTAMAALAQHGRNAYAKISAKPSDDLSAMAGWIHKPGFRPYVPRPVAAAALAAGVKAAPESMGAAR